MKIKRYEIKKRTSEKDVLKAGAKPCSEWMNLNAKLYLSKYVPVGHSEIEIRVFFNEKISDWDDITNVSVFDTDAGKEYAMFNKYLCNFMDVDGTRIENLVREYNSFMDSLPFLKESKGEAHA